MPRDPNKLSRFWQDLKRRNVVRVITVYTGAAFVILSLVDMVREPFELPNWSFKLVVVLLSIGLIIAVILSWIFDINPEGGLVKTEPVEKVKAEDIPKSSSGWKIATYVSVVIIAGLIAYNIFGKNRGARIDESLAKSIAVLPFHNYSGDPGQDYMCEGLAADIISHLFKVRSFDEVKSLTSVLAFKDPNTGISEIAQVLNVNYILEGSYRRINDRLVVTATLIEAKSGNAIWEHDYDPPYNEIMGIPGDIALHIADHLRAFMTEGEQQSLNRIPTHSLEAYEISNQIIYQFRRFLSGNWALDTIVTLSDSAIALDPEYAEAYGYLGYVTILRISFAGDKEVSEAWEAEKYFKMALELDPYNLMANFGLAVINWWVKWDYVGIEEFKKAFPNALNDYFIAQMLPLFELQMGHYNEVLLMLEKDTVTDYIILANILLGNFRKAKDQIHIMIAGSSQFSDMYTGESYIWLQEFDSALYYFEPAQKSGNSIMLFPRFQAGLAVATFMKGNKDLARSTIYKLVERSDTTTIGYPAYFIGWYYSWTGNPDSAFFWLDKAVVNMCPEIPWLKVDPAFKSLKEDPRYLDLYERTGFKTYDDYMAKKKE